MPASLDKSALFAAIEAFWDTEGGNDRGVEAAICAYLDRLGLGTFNDMAARKRAMLAKATARSELRQPSTSQACLPKPTKR